MVKALARNRNFCKIKNSFPFNNKRSFKFVNYFYCSELVIEIKEKKPELPKVDSLKFKLLLGLIRSNSSILRSVYRYLSFLNSLPIKGKKKKKKGS